jgi:hypothetical protein
MTPRELPDVLTSATVPQLAAALWRAASRLGLDLSREAVGLLLAQVGLETGLGRSCHCWNLGNAKSRPGDGRSWTFFACTEVIGGQERWYYPPDPTTRFRAFASLDEGATDYLGMMRRNFAVAWGTLAHPDPAAFVRALKGARYFTADEGLYTRGVAALYRQILARLPADLDTVAMPWTEADEAAVAAECPGNALTLTSIGVCLGPPAGLEVIAHDDTAPLGEDQAACLTAATELVRGELAGA